MYSGRLHDDSLSIEQLVELLLLSDRYEVDSLKQTCEYALQHHIDLDSALYFFNMADQYNARILKVIFGKEFIGNVLIEVFPEFLFEFHSATPRTDRM